MLALVLTGCGDDGSTSSGNTAAPTGSGPTVAATSDESPTTTDDTETDTDDTETAAAPTSAAESDAPAAAEGDWFPHEQGFTWQYQVSQGDETFTQTQTVETVDSQGDDTLLQLRIEYPDGDGGTTTLASQVLVHPDGSLEFPPTQTFSGGGVTIDLRESDGILWPAPGEAADSSERTGSYEFDYGPEGSAQTFEGTWTARAVGPETMTVPAGTFEAHRVEQEVTGGMYGDILQTTWLVEGMGPVRTVTEFAQDLPDMTTELVATTSG